MATYDNNSLVLLLTQLKSRLGYVSGTPAFWTDTELNLRLAEATQMINSLTGFSRAIATFNTAAGTAIYDLATELSTQRPRTTTNRDIIASLQYHLMETGTSSTWTGPQFTATHIADAMTRAWLRLLSTTGISVTQTATALTPGPVYSATLDDNTTDIRRVVWRTAEGRDYPLYPSDERAATSYNRAWRQSPGIPYSYSLIGGAPRDIRFQPPILEAGTLRTLTVQPLVTDFAGYDTALAIPNDLSWAVIWGTLALLLRGDGDNADPQRAQLAAQLEQLGLEATANCPSVLHLSVNDVAAMPCTLRDLDTLYPGWETRDGGTPTAIAMIAPDLVALYPVPDDVYSVSVTCVSAISTGGAYLQLGDELADAVLALAEHLALFKCGGAELSASIPAAQAAIETASRYRARLDAFTPNASWMMRYGTSEQDARPLARYPEQAAASQLAMDRQEDARKERNARRKA
jgi:hypothetical protein